MRRNLVLMGATVLVVGSFVRFYETKRDRIAISTRLQPTAVVAEKSGKELADIDEKSTHIQTRTIDIGSGNKKVNAFCLSSTGAMLAACGTGPGEIRVLNDQGKLLSSWDISVKPEAIGCASDGTILVGGDGKLFKFSDQGKVLLETDAPHATSIRNHSKVLREEAIAYIERTKTSQSSVGLKGRVDAYERIIKQLHEKGEKEELSDQESSMLKSLSLTLEKMKVQYDKEKEKEENAKDEEKDAGPSDEAIATQVDRLIKSKMRIASMSTDGESIFVATPALKGYGFAIWKMNQSMSDGEEIVTGLSGCCGQMDVQACKNGLYVAENSRARVVCYDSNGKEIRNWGKADRTGLDGFTSCCNPMNVCFNRNGDVFTAESNTGRIKRFSAEGEFLDFVGDVKLVPGCKNVSIAVTPDHSKVYMLDLTRNHIVVMEKKTDESREKPPTVAVSND